MKNQQYNKKDIFNCYQFFQKAGIKFRARQLANAKSFYISCLYYQSSVHISYSQLYSVQSYHITENFNFDDNNIYNASLNQIQDNQNSSSEQKKSEQNESDAENYFADHVNILALKTRIC